MSDFLNKYALRTYLQVLVHIVVAIVLGIILALTLYNKVYLKPDDFTAISSSISIASAALLAVYLALFFFFSNNFLTQRNRNIEKLSSVSSRLRNYMERLANTYPEISRKLSLFYDKTLHYFPGQPVDMKDIDERNSQFLHWISKESKKYAKELDAGDPKTYTSYEMSIRDAYVLEVELVRVFRMLHSLYLWSRTIPTFIPLMLTWVIILVISMIFSIVGNMNIITENYTLPAIIVPIYLLFVSLFALIKDVNAIIMMTRNLETAYESVMEEIPDIKSLKG